MVTDRAGGAEQACSVSRLLTMQGLFTATANTSSVIDGISRTPSFPYEVEELQLGNLRQLPEVESDFTKAVRLLRDLHARLCQNEPASIMIRVLFDVVQKCPGAASSITQALVAFGINSQGSVATVPAAQASPLMGGMDQSCFLGMGQESSMAQSSFPGMGQESIMTSLLGMGSMAQSSFPGMGQESSMAQSSFLDMGQESSMAQSSFLDMGQESSMAQSSFLGMGQESSMATVPAAQASPPMGSMDQSGFLGLGQESSMTSLLDMCSMAQSSFPGMGQESSMAQSSFPGMGQESSMAQSSFLDMGQESSMAQSSFLGMGQESSMATVPAAQASPPMGNMAQSSFPGMGQESSMAQSSFPGMGQESSMAQSSFLGVSHRSPAAACSTNGHSQDESMDWRPQHANPPPGTHVFAPSHCTSPITGVSPDSDRVIGNDFFLQKDDQGRIVTAGHHTDRLIVSSPGGLPSRRRLDVQFWGLERRNDLKEMYIEHKSKDREGWEGPGSIVRPRGMTIKGEGLPDGVKEVIVRVTVRPGRDGRREVVRDKMSCIKFYRGKKRFPEDKELTEVKTAVGLVGKAAMIAGDKVSCQVVGGKIDCKCILMPIRWTISKVRSREPVQKVEISFRVREKEVPIASMQLHILAKHPNHAPNVPPARSTMKDWDNSTYMS